MVNSITKNIGMQLTIQQPDPIPLGMYCSVIMGTCGIYSFNIFWGSFMLVFPHNCTNLIFPENGAKVHFLPQSDQYLHGLLDNNSDICGNGDGTGNHYDIWNKLGPQR